MVFAYKSLTPNYQIFLYDPAKPVDFSAWYAAGAHDALRTPMGDRHDPCVLDTFLAAKDFMTGGPAQPWWHFTAPWRWHYSLMAQPHVVA